MTRTALESDEGIRALPPCPSQCGRPPFHPLFHLHRSPAEGWMIKVRTPVRACTSHSWWFFKAAAGCEGERDGMNKRLRVRNLALT